MSLLVAQPVLHMVLDETEAINLLIEFCKLYFSKELFIIELRILAFYNHQVTFPLLNCVVKSNKINFIQLLPKLHQDLLSQKVDTLNGFVINMSGIPVQEPNDDLTKRIISEMCVKAASAIKLQCGREYGFSDGETARATVLSSLSAVDLQDLATNNHTAERDLSKYDCLSAFTKCRNRKFTPVTSK